ncbi:rRNA maturation RNase YbeY [Aphanothece hegewaldii CCALA 016]|uniref:Endoribonuclease YbeY n=1 Tax=Aphanothece hegewaldii CCALA 016 TaxID=2107694 RepID=A0A2T1LZ64_9CHRO|nr:rRNA maturation RNase YbeY [Aphanothece hegewaldii]PSF37700.1 rRNA maturation RNase YbeY [Aphanothece hegewaldii CCALA 016]
MASSASTLAIEINVQDDYYTESSCPITPQTWQNWIQEWFNILSPTIQKANNYEISLLLTDDTGIQELNAQYRQKDQPTDVLAFAILETDFPLPSEIFLTEALYLGDIIISVETANRQAQQHGYSLKQELAWLAAHGFLHLLGWDHPDEEHLLLMLSQQETLLSKVGLLPQNQ